MPGEWLPVATLQASGSAWGAIREAFLRIVMLAGPKAAINGYARRQPYSSKVDKKYSDFRRATSSTTLIQSLSVTSGDSPLVKFHRARVFKIQRAETTKLCSVEDGCTVCPAADQEGQYAKTADRRPLGPSSAG